MATRHVFLELVRDDGLEKLAYGEQPVGPDPMGVGGAPPTSMPMDPNPQTVPPAAAGIPQQGAGPQQQWVGPRVGAFPNRRATINMQIPTESMGAALEAVTTEYPYMNAYPKEPRMVKNTGDLIVGEIMVAVPQRRNVAIPFAVKDGSLMPPVAIVVDGEWHAIPSSDTEFAHLMGTPQPIIATSSNKRLMPNRSQAGGDDKIDISKGPDGDVTDDHASNSSRRAVGSALPKYASFVDAIAGTPFGSKVHDILIIPESVVQMERVPFGAIEKVAHADSFSPRIRNLKPGDIPRHVMDAFGHRRVITIVRDPYQYGDGSLEKTASVTVTLLDPDEVKPGMGVKGYNNDRGKFPMRVVKQIGWGDSDSEQMVAVSRHGMAKELNGSNRLVKCRPARLELEPVTDMWKYPGKKMMVMLGQNKAMKPIGVIKKNRVFMGSYFSKSIGMSDRDSQDIADVVISTTIVKPMFSAGKVYLPSDAKAVFLTTDESYMDTGIEKVASGQTFPDRRVDIQRRRDGYFFSGNPVRSAKWDDEPLEKVAFTEADVVFILGAMGVPEYLGLEKVAAAEKDGKSAVLVHRDLVTETQDYDVDLGFMKLAAAVPQHQDELLAIQMMGSDTMDMFIKRLPDLFALTDNLAKLTFAAQIGMEPLDPESAYQATKNVQKVTVQLSQLASMREGQA